MDILEESVLSDGPLSIVWESQWEDHPRSDKSGLSLYWRRKAIRGYPPFLGNIDDNRPLRWNREDQACRRGFPESMGRQLGGLPSPWGGLCVQVSRGRVCRGSCAESSPEEESTGVVRRRLDRGRVCRGRAEVIVWYSRPMLYDILLMCAWIAASHEVLSACTTYVWWLCV